MYDGGKILVGLVIFLALVTFPIWYHAVQGKPPVIPDPKIITDAKQCVATTPYMKTNHMTLLNEWRDQVVRHGARYMRGIDGKVYEMSLTNTCMNCHSNKSEFCDQCHTYMDVNPYCWDCHIEPQEQVQ